MTMRFLLLLALAGLALTAKIGRVRKVVSEEDSPAIEYPIRAAYIDRSEYWYGDSVAKALAVPGFAP